MLDDKYLWKFHWDCGRAGDVMGLFVATEKEIDEAIGKEVNFGGILGKHSEVCGDIKESEIAKVNLAPEIVERVAEPLGQTWSGYNPLEYIQYECVECEDRYEKGEMSKVSDELVCIYCEARRRLEKLDEA